jgi:death-on-curing protein
LHQALHRPQQLYFYQPERMDLARLAAAYSFGYTRHMAFERDNSRLAYLMARVFLLINGWTLIVTREEKYKTLAAFAAGAHTEESFANWIRAHHMEYSPAT